MKFGVHLGPQELDFADLLEAWRMIEELGFDWISVWDHLYPTLGSGSVEGKNIEATVALTALAMVTERVRVGCLVFNASMRNPALLAHSLAAIDELSQGRIEVGMGAGWFEREQVDAGIPFPPPGVRVGMLEESVQILRLLFSQEEASFEGRYYRITSARCEPKPVQDRVRIWIGGFRPRVLALAGRLGDGFNIAYVSPEIWKGAWAKVRHAAVAAGRDPAEIEPSANVGLFLRATEEQARQDCLYTMGPQVAAMGGHLVGPSEKIVEQVAAYRDAGVERLNVVLRPPLDLEGLRSFSEEVVPEFAQE